MLTPEVLEYILNSLKTHKKLQESIIRDIVRRIIKNGLSPADNLTETTVYQAGVLQKAGVVYRDIIKIVAEESDNLYYDVKNAFDAAGLEIFNYDEDVLLSNGYELEIVSFLSLAMKKLWEAALDKVFTEATNLTKTVALTSQTAFISACDLAHMQIASGAFAYGQAIANAAKQASVQGVNVLYPSGANASLDYAVRRAVLTGVNQTAARLTEMKADELNHDLMETSAHYGARAEHAEWQGQVVSRSGAPGYLTLSDVGYGSVTGIFGANCRHNWFMYFGVPSYTAEQLADMKNKTVTYNGQEMSVYDARQKQRGFERNVKATKRELVGLDEAMKHVPEAEKAIIKAEFQSSAAKLKQQESRLAEFCRQTGLKRDTFREQVFTVETENNIKSWTKSVSQKAVWGDRKNLQRIKYEKDIKPTLPKVAKSNDTLLQNKLDYDIIYNNEQKVGIVPSRTALVDVHIMAGYGSSANIRVAKDLSHKYGGEYWKWQKKTGAAHSKYGIYEIHWYEYNGKQYEHKLKRYKEK